MIFRLEGKELEKAIEFIERQREDSRSEGCSGGRFSYTFTPCSIGLSVFIHDNITKEECNVTDYSMW